jgi:hypothetical protein
MQYTLYGGSVATPLQFGAGAVVTNLSSSGVIYYGDSPATTSASYQGTISAAGSVTLAETQYLVVARTQSRVDVDVQPSTVLVGSDSATLDVTRPPYSVVPGVSSAAFTAAAINQAIADASALGTAAVAGQEPTVLLNSPQYPLLVNLSVEPTGVGGRYAAAVWLRSNVRLRSTPGTVVKLADAQTIPAGAVGATAVVSPTAPFSTTALKQNIQCENVVVDANGANNSTLVNGAPLLPNGMILAGCSGGMLIRCKVKGLYGTGNSPPQETFHFDFNNCDNCQGFFCEADGSPLVNTATGFSANNSTNCAWVDCHSHDMGQGLAFTHWQSANLSYISCTATKCQAGFNSERSENIRYTACDGGGRSALIDATNYSQNPYYPGGQTTLGNATAGFNILGSKHVTMVGCHSTYNGTYGLVVKENTGLSRGTTTGDTTSGSNVITNVADTTNFAVGQVLKGPAFASGLAVISAKTANTITVQTRTAAANNASATAAGVTLTSWVLVDSDSVSWVGGSLANNTTAPTLLDFFSTNVQVGPTVGRTDLPNAHSWYYGRQPTLEYNSAGFTGIKQITNAISGFDVAYQWQTVAKGTIATLNGSGQLVTTGRARARRSVTANTTITYADEILAVTVTSAVTVTLPSTAAVNGISPPPGTTFTIKNENNAVAAITVACGGADTFEDGTTSKSITAALASLTLYWSGSKWMVG